MKIRDVIREEVMRLGLFLRKRILVYTFFLDIFEIFIEIDYVSVIKGVLGNFKEVIDCMYEL